MNCMPIARLDGVGFEIAPSGDQERFVPEGEEVAWRWTLSARQPGQQRLSVQLRLRWVPGPGRVPARHANHRPMRAGWMCRSPRSWG